MKTVVQKIEAIVTPVAESLGLDLVDVEFIQEGGHWYVRVYVEKMDGDVTLGDCATVSQRIDEEVDALIDKKFFLEVSSPGIERPLKKEADFVRFAGKKIFVALEHKLDGVKSFEGKLKAYEDSKVFLEVKDTVVEIPFSEVKKAHIVFDFDEM